MTEPGQGQPESKILRRARQLAGMRDFNSHEAIVAWAHNVLTLLELLRGPDHAAVEDLRRYVDSWIIQDLYTQQNFQVTVRGAAQGLVNDIESGFLPDLATKIRGQVEGDFLGQAHRLLEERLKDPAAMLVGAVLEDALRQLCRKHEVAEGDTIEAMNVPLRKAEVYELPQQQQVTAWAAIRNKADHGRFGEYKIDEVRLMHQGVAGFVVRYLGGEA